MLNFSHISSTPVSDGGDIIVLSGQSFSTQTNAFRYIVSFEYLTEFFYFNESVINSTTFLYNEIPVPDFRVNATIDSTIGTVLFDRDELETSAFSETTVKLILTNSIRSGAVYNITFKVYWNSMPYGFDGGRSYHYASTIRVPTSDISLSFSYYTSNPFTPGPNLQVQEMVFINITILFPEVRLVVLEFIFSYIQHIVCREPLA